VNEPELFAQDILSAFPVFGNPVSDGTVMSVELVMSDLIPEGWVVDPLAPPPVAQPVDHPRVVVGALSVSVRLDDADTQGSEQRCDWSGAFNTAILAGLVTVGTRVKVLNGSAFILDRIIVGAK
jgi:hypothetical protein